MQIYIKFMLLALMWIVRQRCEWRAGNQISFYDKPLDKINPADTLQLCVTILTSASNKSTLSITWSVSIKLPAQHFHSLMSFSFSFMPPPAASGAGKFCLSSHYFLWRRIIPEKMLRGRWKINWFGMLNISLLSSDIVTLHPMSKIGFISAFFPARSSLVPGLWADESEKALCTHMCCMILHIFTSVSFPFQRASEQHQFTLLFALFLYWLRCIIRFKFIPSNLSSSDASVCLSFCASKFNAYVSSVKVFIFIYSWITFVISPPFMNFIFWLYVLWSLCRDRSVLILINSGKLWE